MHRWLNHEIARVRGITVRRWHLHTLILVAVAVLVGVTAGFFAGYHYPYRTLPRPPLPPGQTAPPQDCSHVMGGCLPRPDTTIRAPTFTALTVRAAGPPSGPDLSNNDPVPCIAFTSIAIHSRFMYDKSVEGASYFDGTAAGMAQCARAHHLPVGGYDFMHVCLVNPTSEALFFVASLHTQRLLGVGTLPPAGDAEYPVSGHLACSGRVWIQTWVDTVYAHDGHVCPILYTGAWWWQPAIGYWWPTCLGHQLLAWVSGYGVHYPYMPAGVSHLDLWQLSDHAFNGWSYADLSVYLSGVQPFARFLGQPIVPKPNPYAIFPGSPYRLSGRLISERATVAWWDRRHCTNPVRRSACRQLRGDLVLLRDRAWFVAHHTPPPAWRPLQHGRWDRAHLGRRFQQINRRVNSGG